MKDKTKDKGTKEIGPVKIRQRTGNIRTSLHKCSISKYKSKLKKVKTRLNISKSTRHKFDETEDN